MKIGIVIPLKIEAKPFISVLKGKKSDFVCNHQFFRGTLGIAEVITVVGGHGKIKCAAAVQLLISHYKPDFVIHFGSAGALSERVRIGDIVVAEAVVEHDFHSKFGQERKPPRVAVEKNIQAAFLAYMKKCDQRFHTGLMVSGNEDIITAQRRDEIFTQFQGVSVDWESCACIQVADFADVPCLVVRIIVDGAHEQTHGEYSVGIKELSAKLSHIIVAFIKQKQE